MCDNALIETPLDGAQVSLLPHPLAELFPLMTGADFDALVNDIAANGQRQPVVLFEGKILDGRNRYRACTQIGVVAKTEEFTGPSPHAYVASMNLHRRHLKESQRALIASQMAKLSVGRPREETETIGEISPISISQTEAARHLNVSRDSVKYARVVLEKGTPEEIAGVKDGRLRVSTVAKAIQENVTPADRIRNRAIPSHKKGKMPKKFENQRLNGAVWGQLRDALTNLSGLPSPADVAKIARGMDRTNLVNQRLGTASSWITEFEDAWTRAE